MKIGDSPKIWPQKIHIYRTNVVGNQAFRLVFYEDKPIFEGGQKGTRGELCRCTGLDAFRTNQQHEDYVKLHPEPPYKCIFWGWQIASFTVLVTSDVEN